MSKEFLIEDYNSPVMITLNESKSDNVVRFKGKFQEANKPNKNKRIYPEAVLRREVDRIEEAIKSRGLMGELDHPQDSIVHLDNVSHIVTKLWWEGNILMGEGEVLPTAAGMILKKLIESNLMVGISSRGLGSGVTRDDGILEISESYRLITFDMVADPSTYSAFQKKIVNKNEYVEKIDNFVKNENNNINNINAGTLISYVGQTIQKMKNDLKERSK